MKRPKKVKLNTVPYESYYIQYQCPHCKTYFQEYSFNKKITRFICSQCGIELIVSK